MAMIRHCKVFSWLPCLAVLARSLKPHIQPGKTGNSPGQQYIRNFNTQN